MLIEKVINISLLSGFINLLKNIPHSANIVIRDIKIKLVISALN